MDESIIPSLSTGVVGSRFVSQNDLDNAKARRDEQWKAAYARFSNILFYVDLLTSNPGSVRIHHHSNKKILMMVAVLLK
jgi:hypothetical protein